MGRGNNNWSATSIALLGIIIGVLGSNLVFRACNSNTINYHNVSYANWQKLSFILNQVERNYVDTVDIQSMTDAAITAALAELDPHSIYLPPEDLTESETELAGNFDGIGIQFNVPNDTAIVMEVIQGGPSEKIGLQKGDRILKVDDTVIAGVQFPQDSMVRRMKGPAGSKVTITVSRDGQEVPFQITRGQIPVNSVDAAIMLDNNSGYIRLSKFTRNTYVEFMEAVHKLQAQGMTNVIVDLRENTGGYFDQVCLMCNEFLERGDEVVYIMGRNTKREDCIADGSGTLKTMPVTVIIDEESASASEIFAGAIQDNDRGTIVGRRSFGKGLVQEPLYFTDGSAIRITVARYYTPSGRCIQKPYKDYYYDLYNRYMDGEMLSADSIKVDSSQVYRTVGGRAVYGGGGIVPDVFVPIDTISATNFYVKCSKKATAMRFASAIFDQNKARLSGIDNFNELTSYLDALDLKRRFLDYAEKTDGITPEPGEWEKSESYLLPQIRALVGRYSKLGDDAYYKLYIGIDSTVQKALEIQTCN